jgi:FlhB-like protein
MVMIPTDVGVQVRAQTEPGLGPVRAIAEIPSDLPDLQQGQVFRARIQEVLPENTYKALVAGRSLTLSLPEGAKAGDTLELVVVDRTPRAIVAQTVQPGTAALGEPYQQARLSSTGQLIAALLPREGDTAVPVALTRGRPVLAQVPVSAAEMARTLPAQLAQAVGSSGLFYEAHQVQWVLGQWPRSSLLAEPQGEYSRDGVRAGWLPLPEEPSPQESALAARRPTTNSGPPAPTLLQALFGGGASAAARLPPRTPASRRARSATRAIPEDLRPLVQQQLEAAATQRLAWHGEVWPRQEMDWEIQRDAPQRERRERWRVLPHGIPTCASPCRDWARSTHACNSAARPCGSTCEWAEPTAKPTFAWPCRRCGRRWPPPAWICSRQRPAMDKPDSASQRTLAVALKYAGGDSAPTVVAKGRGLIADEIVARAKESGVYVHESPVLVALLAQLDLDQHIPPALYLAVAELLAWLYQVERGEPPVLSLPAGEGKPS